MNLSKYQEFPDIKINKKRFASEEKQSVTQTLFTDFRLGEIIKSMSENIEQLNQSQIIIDEHGQQIEVQTDPELNLSMTDSQVLSSQTIVHRPAQANSTTQMLAALQDFSLHHKMNTSLSNSQQIISAHDLLNSEPEQHLEEQNEKQTLQSSNQTNLFNVLAQFSAPTIHQDTVLSSQQLQNIIQQNTHQSTQTEQNLQSSFQQTLIEYAESQTQHEYNYIPLLNNECQTEIKQFKDFESQTEINKIMFRLNTTALQTEPQNENKLQQTNEIIIEVKDNTTQVHFIENDQLTQTELNIKDSCTQMQTKTMQMNQVKSQGFDFQFKISKSSQTDKQLIQMDKIRYQQMLVDQKQAYKEYQIILTQYQTFNAKLEITSPVYKNLGSSVCQIDSPSMLQQQLKSFQRITFDLQKQLLNQNELQAEIDQNFKLIQDLQNQVNALNETNNALNLQVTEEQQKFALLEQANVLLEKQVKDLLAEKDLVQKQLNVQNFKSPINQSPLLGQLENKMNRLEYLAKENEELHDSVLNLSCEVKLMKLQIEQKENEEKQNFQPQTKLNPNLLLLKNQLQLQQTELDKLQLDNQALQQALK
ncbi:Hypothetical_protein [Hexamita inflata]|uniref:Hypothetical_protein n=1 Tax=Hexamita inflata TaxID=28002 RepID=A0AA86UZW4_9EUKA|nr:Hypothetical protein HINF_LOCUS58546 [Hexamita inflata]